MNEEQQEIIKGVELVLDKLVEDDREFTPSPGVALTTYRPTEVNQSALIGRPIDNTALADFMSCPTKYFYGMVLNRRARGAIRPALAFGKSMHSALEAHYKTGGDHAAVELAVVESWEQHDSPDDHRTWERVLSVYDQFVQHYGSHDDETAAYGTTVGYLQGNPLVEIPTEIGWPGCRHPYTGRIDRIIEWQGLYYIEDHKTTSQLGPYYFQQFNPSNQMMGYVWLAKQLTGLPIAGVRINAIGVLKTQTKFARQLISYSQDRLVQWAQNYGYWIENIERCLDVYHNLLENPEFQGDILDAANVAFPHNFNACAGKYGMCQYTEVCSQPVPLQRKVLESSYGVNEWKPLEAVLDGEAE